MSRADFKCELTPRDMKIVELVAAGLKNKDIASSIGKTDHVVKNYLQWIYDRLGFYNRVEVALWFTKLEWDRENQFLLNGQSISS